MDWHRIEIWRLRGAVAYAARLTAAALLALFLAHRLHVTLPLWSVLTALIVTQVSLGRSLKATVDYFAGTVGGVVWGGFVALFLQNMGEAGLLLAMAIALAPLSLLAAIYPRLSAGPVTAAIVVLIPGIIHVSPLASATERTVEVLLGGLTGLFVSFVLVPWSAFDHTREIASDVLKKMAHAVPELMEGFQSGLSGEQAHIVQDAIGRMLNELSSITAEAERERPLRLSSDPLTGPLFRTLLRLRHDLVILGRAAQTPLPPALEDVLGEPLKRVQAELVAYFEACAKALLAKDASPASESLDAAILSYTGGIETLRQANRLREQPVEAVEFILASAFALDQIRHDTGDLGRCLNDWQMQRR